eukprot:CAMPEP_0118828530 /NCGR_PEP_ID=MMETSP1162-20130426/18962_1 /TAXON_ID=33656 /ORGANISM="Phaeocystis Sp, Strain CCMP2710" /LENGTH=213 /DNA_ID=CAMNT_0006759549 /DNA_START=29 /DNA_END=670 /DNA_ORIENTATION=-
MVSRVISPRQLTQTLTGTSKRLGLISSSPAAVLPRQTAQVQRGPSGAAASWSIEDPDARFRERRGHTVAVLRDSYPNFFSDLPNFEIYTHDIQFLHSGVPEGRLRGIRAYRQLFDALRLTRNTAVADADLSYHLSLPSEATIRVRWHARLWLRMPLPSLGSIVGVHAAAPLLVDGVSLYELDGDARVRVHSLEYVERTWRPEHAHMSPALAMD